MCNKYSNIARQKKEKKKVQLTKDDAFLYWSSSCAVSWWPIFRKLGTCSTTDNLSPRTLLTKKLFVKVCKKSSNIERQKKKKKREKKEKVQLTKDDAFLYWSSSCAVCWWPIFRKLGTCSTTDALSPRTLLTENICESVQKILQHSPAKKRRKKRFNSPKMMPFFTGPLPVQCPGGQFSGSLAPAPRRTTCRLGHF